MTIDADGPRGPTRGQRVVAGSPQERPSSYPGGVEASSGIVVCSGLALPAKRGASQAYVPLCRYLPVVSPCQQTSQEMLLATIAASLALYAIPD